MENIIWNSRSRVKVLVREKSRILRRWRMLKLFLGEMIIVKLIQRLNLNTLESGVKFFGGKFSIFYCRNFIIVNGQDHDDSAFKITKQTVPGAKGKKYLQNKISCSSIEIVGEDPYIFDGKKEPKVMETLKKFGPEYEIYFDLKVDDDLNDLREFIRFSSIDKDEKCAKVKGQNDCVDGMRIPELLLDRDSGAGSKLYFAAYINRATGFMKDVRGFFCTFTASWYHVVLTQKKEKVQARPKLIGQIHIILL